MSDLEIGIGIDYFYRGHWATRFQMQKSLSARREMFKIWKAAAVAAQISCHSILDVGATPDTERLDSNCMIPWFLNEGSNVTLYSIEDIDHLLFKFPGITILQSNGPTAEIPSESKKYDWAISSATLEHVGSKILQERFIAELGRVANGIFLTTPNRSHWLEFHTKLPLLHWLPRGIHRAFLRLIGLGFWAKESNLRLVNSKELRDLAENALGNDYQFEIKSVSSLGMQSNLILIGYRKTFSDR